MIGQSVGKYRVLDRIGRGGMGTVYRAIDDTLQREVAIKVLNAEVSDAESLRRFRTEAITLARLHHPAIATLFELHEDDGRMMMVMEFVRGETLQGLAERMGRVPPDFAAQLCAQALDGLSHAHRAGIIHRDLKPGNMMMTPDGIVKVMDFGIARVAGSEHLTSAGFMMGTPAYMAPEQVLGEEADARSDLYSMGVVLYRLWTGQLPFNGETPISIAHKQVNEPPTPLSVANPSLPAWCEAVLTRALAKQPKDRFQTAQEFRAALVASASFIRLDDVDTRTMETPRSVPVPIPESFHAAVTAPVTAQAPVTNPSDRTFVISARHMFAGVSTVVLFLVLLAAGGIFAVLKTRSSGTDPAAAGSAPAASTAPADSKPADSAAVPPSPEPPAPSAPTLPPPQPAPAPAPVSTTTSKPASATPSAPGATPPLPGSTPSAPGGTPSTTAAAGRTGTASPDAGLPSGRRPPAPAGERGTPAAPAPPASAAPPVPAAATKPPAVTVTFSKVKLVVIDGDKAREDESELQLGDGHLVIYGPSRRILASVPYDAITAVTTARSKQPRWRDPDGTIKNAKVGGGALGFMKGDRNWLGFITRDKTIVLRVDDDKLAAVTKAASDHTGVPTTRLPK